MANNYKQAMKVKNSRLYASIWKGQALYFGWLKITKTFTSKTEAVAWYDKHQEGWRYNNAVAVVWQGCSRKTSSKFLKDALCGGEEWRYTLASGAKSQAQCEWVLFAKPYILG